MSLKRSATRYNQQEEEEECSPELVQVIREETTRTLVEAYESKYYDHTNMNVSPLPDLRAPYYFSLMYGATQGYGNYGHYQSYNILPLMQEYKWILTIPFEVPNLSNQAVLVKIIIGYYKGGSNITPSSPGVDTNIPADMVAEIFGIDSTTPVTARPLMQPKAYFEDSVVIVKTDYVVMGRLCRQTASGKFSLERHDTNLMTMTYLYDTVATYHPVGGDWFIAATCDVDTLAAGAPHFYVYARGTYM